MSQTLAGEQITIACRELGLSDAVAEQIKQRAIALERENSASGGISAEQAQKMSDREAEIMRLINCKSPDKILHDLRNLLNELQLLKAVANLDRD